MKELPVDAWFAVFWSAFIAGMAGLACLRRVEWDLALTLICVSGTILLGAAGTLLGLPRGPWSVLSVFRTGLLVAAVWSLARYWRTRRWSSL